MGVYAPRARPLGFPYVTYGHHYGKRSADPEPAYRYLGYHGVYPYAHHRYAVKHVAGTPASTYLYTHSLHKRSADADAEPTADAEPGYGYVHHGYYAPHARPLGFPYVTYGHHYGKRSADAEPGHSYVHVSRGYHGHHGYHGGAHYGYGVHHG